MTKALVPLNDPELRETTPKTVGAITLDDVKHYHERTIRPDLATIVVIGDVTAAEARPVIEKWFGAWRANGPKPDITLPPVPRNKVSAVTVPDPSSLQDTVTVAEEIDINRYSPDYYPLHSRKPRAGRRLLRHPPLSRSAPDHGLRLQRRRAARRHAFRDRCIR